MLTQSEIKKALTQYLFFCRYVRDELQNAVNTKQPFTHLNEPKIDNSFTTSGFYQAVIKKFNDRFEEWLREMGRNQRAFVPFDLQTKMLGQILNGIKTKKGLFGEKKIAYSDFTDELNGFAKQKYPTTEQKVFEVFYGATDKLLKEFYHNF